MAAATCRWPGGITPGGGFRVGAKDRGSVGARTGGWTPFWVPSSFWALCPDTTPSWMVWGNIDGSHSPGKRRKKQIGHHARPRRAPAPAPLRTGADMCKTRSGAGKCAGAKSNTVRRRSNHARTEDQAGREKRACSGGHPSVATGFAICTCIHPRRPQTSVCNACVSAAYVLHAESNRGLAPPRKAEAQLHQK